MYDKSRILAKIRELDSYIGELEEIAPETFEEYKESAEKRRACERLLQISIEAVIDIAYLLAKGLKAGIPSDEEGIFEILKKKKVLAKEIAETLREMKGFRNILVHRYGTVDDELVFEAIRSKVADFEAFKEAVLKFLKGK